MAKLRVEVFDHSKVYKGLKTFDCGNDMINTFVQKSLKKRVKKHLSQAYILLEDDYFSGFYTLDTFSITKESFEIEIKPTALPPVVPVVKIGMLGVSKHLQGKGVGKKLLKDAFVKVIQISKLAGCAGVFLLAEKDAIPFYENLGFIAIKKDEPLPMFLSIDTLIKA
jgi:GNAT superfamily N-acetyltransferase